VRQERPAASEALHASYHARWRCVGNHADTCAKQLHIATGTLKHVSISVHLQRQMRIGYNCVKILVSVMGFRDMIGALLQAGLVYSRIVRAMSVTSDGFN